MCRFSESEIGAAFLFIKAEETKQQIKKLNSEVRGEWEWMGKGDRNSTYNRSSVIYKPACAPGEKTPEPHRALGLLTLPVTNPKLPDCR